MDFDFDPDQLALRELALSVAGRFEDTYWQRVDEDSRFPSEFWSALTKSDLLGVAIPERFGGSGKGLLELAVAAEAIAEGGAGMEGGGLFVSGPVFAGCLLTRHGRPDQQAAYLPGVAHGDVWAGAFTEPDAGSNITAVRTRATADGDGYLVNGEKTFISQMRVARHIVVMARTEPYDPQHRTRGISLLLGDLPDPAVEARPFKKMGSRFMDTNAVHFTNYRVPAGNVVGNPASTWTALYDTLNPERIVLAATAVGTGHWVLKRAVRYACERAVWGGAIAAHQGIQFPLVRARIALDSARLKAYEAAWLYDRGRDCGVAAAMAKYGAAHAALAAADAAIQTLGGAGYVSESGVERHWRNLRLNRIAPVTDEMTLSYLAQRDLGMPRSY